MSSISPANLPILNRLPTLARMMRIVAHEAGEIAMASFRFGAPTSARIWNKEGGSPVTEADIAVDTFVKARCAEALPEASWLSEETVDDPARLASDLVWVVDPIDGTRAYMAGVPDWCVCIALLSGNTPVLGIVHAPALNVAGSVQTSGATYEALTGAGATLNGKSLRATAGTIDQPRIAGPKPMLEALALHMKLAPQPRVPSLALRLARVADGSLDGGIVSPDSRDWDLAAADLIVQEAGGLVTSLDNARLAYNRPRPVHATLVVAGADLHPTLLAAARQMRAKTYSRS